MMQRIYFHKTVHLEYPLKELISISVDEAIQYKIEFNGMRAIGAVTIRGEYDDGTKRNKFNENIDLDILATNDKIVDKKDFHMKVEDFDYSIQSGLLKLVIQAVVNGVKEDDDKHIHVNNNDNVENVSVIEPHIESLLRQEDRVDMVEKMDDVDELLEQIPKKEMKKEDEVDDDIGVYYFYVVQDGDSYHTISLRYKMEEKVIREYNHNREVREGNVVIIPYVS